MIKQPIKRSALNFNLIENGASMIEQNGWSLASSFGDIEAEVNSSKNSVAITDISNLSKFKIYSPKIDEVLLNTGGNLRISEVRKEHFMKNSMRHSHTTARLSINELWVSSNTNNSFQEIKATYIENDKNVELFEMTSAYTGIRILGPDAPLLLSEFTDINIGLNTFKDLTSAQSMFLQVYGLLIRADLSSLPTYDLFIDRSYGLYVWKAIMSLGARYNAKLVGMECINQLESNP
ncbi:MAG: Glycine cleavage system T protein (aminomethyltransferase) [Chloroflexi bacterium]|jgi:glycine cleavage system aminomethyltransferase T|nr:MAG: Glycine cleavage system T protein (aminomethyltransferase) [Chloroflexota bacterium]